MTPPATPVTLSPERVQQAAHRVLDEALRFRRIGETVVALAAGASPVGLIARATLHVAESTPAAFLQELLGLGLDPNEPAPDHPHDSPLGWALSNRNMNWARLLIQAGADPNVGSRTATPLRLTVGDHDAVARFLLKNGADPLRENDPTWWSEQAPYWRTCYTKRKAESDAGTLARTLPESDHPTFRPRM